MEIGVGSWSMQSIVPSPRSHTLLYSELGCEAELCEDLGIDSLWISEHHGWYDGYSPAPLVASAAALARTSRLRIGTGIVLLPFNEPNRLAQRVIQLDSLSAGRFVLGIAVGYRREEFELFGLDRRKRGQLLEEHLAVMRGIWAGVGYSPPPIWLGGGSQAACDRAARLDLGILLPPPVSVDEVSQLADRYRDAGGRFVGVFRDLWLGTTSSKAQAEVLPWLKYAHAQYAAMEGLTAESEIRSFRDKACEAAIIGTPQAAAEVLAPLVALKPELLVFRVRWASERVKRVRTCMELLTGELLPILRVIA
jgi:alkanesulfonate monooxygenase SsuD/methylene tetrahydromethanopterin reductase-like flavin-dependent oxidoreductase (luciferase family)